MTLDPSDLRWENYWREDVRQAAKQQGDPLMESVHIGRHRQLFIDNWVIEHMQGLRRTLHPAKRHPASPVLIADQPSDEEITWASALYDADEQQFKCWYKVPSGLAYATSSDGLRWDKPSLSSAGNVISTMSGDSITVVKDHDDPDPARRYKIMVKGKPGIRIGFSPDGLNWSLRNEPVITPRNDPGLGDRCTLMIDRSCAPRRFIAFTKREMNNPFGRGDWGMIHRVRCVSFSDDFEHWTDPYLTLRPDDCDPPDLQIYGLVGFNYEGQYLGLMDVYHSGHHGPDERTTEIQLACSRDGQHWWRAGERKAILSPRVDSSWDRYMVFPMNCPPILRGDELWFYYRGRGDRRHRKPVPEHRQVAPWLAPGHKPDQLLAGPGTGMGVATLRRDGFVSLDAGNEPGDLWTRPLWFEGSQLHVNANAAGGSIHVEVYVARQTEAVPNSPSWNWAIDGPVAGFSIDACVATEADRTDAVIRWQGHESLEQFKGQPIVLRFVMQRAALYAFWIV